VLQVIDAMKRVSGVDFDVRMAPRRPGGPATTVAKSEKKRSTLGWKPELDDLDQIVRHALAWEDKLAELKR
jgi:UDP-glucose 4-epimerase